MYKIEDAVVNHQKTIKSLPSQAVYPGIPKEELEGFQQGYHATAFTCRLSSCPRSTIGFETDDHRLEHEASHVTCINCREPNCQCPQLRSVRALKRHEAECHAPPKPRKKIRMVDTTENTTEVCAPDIPAGSGIPKLFFNRTQGETTELVPPVDDKTIHLSPDISADTQGFDLDLSTLSNQDLLEDFDFATFLKGEPLYNKEESCQARNLIPKRH